MRCHERSIQGSEKDSQKMENLWEEIGIFLYKKVQRAWKVHEHYIIKWKWEINAHHPKTCIKCRAGWFALKIEKFVKCQSMTEQPFSSRVSEANNPYVNAVRESKWQSRRLCAAGIRSNNRNMEVTRNIGITGRRISQEMFGWILRQGGQGKTNCYWHQEMVGSKLDQSIWDKHIWAL